jgi:hypothetical protein
MAELQKTGGMKELNWIFAAEEAMRPDARFSEVGLCLSEIKHAHTDDEVRQEMA